MRFRRSASRRSRGRRWRVARGVAIERRLLGLLRPYSGQVAAGLVITALISVMGVARPWPTKILVDNVFGHQRLWGLSNVGGLGVAVALTVLIFALASALALVQKHLFFRLSQDLVTDLRARLFGHLTRLSVRFHEQRATGDSIHRLTNDTYAIQLVLLNGLMPLVSSVLIIGLTVVVMVQLDPLLALLSVVNLPLVALTGRRYAERIRRSWTTYRAREADIFNHAEQTLSGIRVVQAFAREDFELKRFRGRAMESRSAMLTVISLQMSFGLAVDLILALGVALVTWFAAMHALSGQITPGEALVFLAYAATLYTPLTQLTSTFTELQSAAASAQRIFEVLDEQTPADDPRAVAPSERAAGHLRFESVDYAYTEGEPVLRKVCFEVRPGEMVALVGPTGAGKSTILSLALRLFDPVSGSITLDGTPLADMPVAWLRQQIAFVPQDSVLFPVTVRENIRYGRIEAGDGAVEDAARAANILDELLADPRGLDTPVGEGGATLSGGQRQRVAIARAFLRDAPVVILDEPTSALDAITEALVMDALQRLCRGRALLVVAHRLATVQNASTVLVLDGGRVVQAGRHRDLLAVPGCYRDLHAARFGAGVAVGSGADLEHYRRRLAELRERLDRSRVICDHLVADYTWFRGEEIQCAFEASAALQVEIAHIEERVRGLEKEGDAFTSGAGWRLEPERTQAALR